VDTPDGWDGPYVGLPHWSGPPFGEALLKRCDRWCEQDLAVVWHATSPEELWHPLALGGLSGGDSTHHWEVPALLRHHHGDGEPGAIETAFLLLTDLRWSGTAARHTIGGLIGTGLLDEPALDQLAARLFWPDRPVFEHPARWLEPSLGTEIVIDLDRRGKLSRKPVRLRVADMAPVRRRRHLAPPLRRWAAARLVVRHLSQFDAVMARGDDFRRDKPSLRNLDHAAATLQGCLDASDVIDDHQLRLLLECGLAWPRGQVRIDTLTVLARRVGVEEAVALARVDTDAKVRAWAEKLATSSADQKLF